MAVFEVPDALCSGGQLDLARYCLPVFIGGEFGALLEPERTLVFSRPDGDSVRSGTVTFAQLQDEVLALTAGHVIDSLDSARKRYRERWYADFGSPPGVPGAYLFTPLGDIHFHFNYTFTRLTAPHVVTGKPIDLAIARIDRDMIEALGKSAIPVVDPDAASPPFALAAGFPESGRLLTQVSPSSRRLQLSIFQCWSNFDYTAAGQVVIFGEITDTAGANNLSGVSGGPILWSTDREFGLLGIVEQGRDLLPEEQSAVQTPCVWIQGQPVSSTLLSGWLAQVPPARKEQSRTKGVLAPRPR